MAGGVLVAGVGNLFLGDDGFGPEAVRRFAARGAPPPGVRVADYGIRGMHLAYDLLDGYGALVLLDAYPGGGPPGELTVLEVGPEQLGSGPFDAHGMNPVSVLANLDQLGGTLPLTYVVGCTPATVAEGIGLSPGVAAAVPRALAAVDALLRRLAPTAATAATAPTAPTAATAPTAGPGPVPLRRT